MRKKNFFQQLFSIKVDFSKLNTRFQYKFHLKALKDTFFTNQLNIFSIDVAI